MTSDPIPAYSRISGYPGASAYNEVAFRHFLAADRRRAARGTQTLLLVLVGIRRSHGQCALLSEATATAIFDALTASVREVDYVGWYRDGYIGAAVLPQSARPDAAVRSAIAERLSRVLRAALPGDHARQLRLRVIPLAGTSQGGT